MSDNKDKKTYKAYHVLDLLTLLRHAVKNNRYPHLLKKPLLSRTYLLALDKALNLSPANAKGEHVYLYNKLLPSIRKSIRAGKGSVDKDASKIEALLSNVRVKDMKTYVEEQKIDKDFSAVVLYPKGEEALAAALSHQLAASNRPVFAEELDYAPSDWVETARLCTAATQTAKTAHVLILITPESLGDSSASIAALRRFCRGVEKQKLPYTPLFIGWDPAQFRRPLKRTMYYSPTLTETVTEQIALLLPEQKVPSPPAEEADPLVSSLIADETFSPVLFCEDLDGEAAGWPDTGVLLLRPKEMEFRSRDTHFSLSSREYAVQPETCRDKEGREWVRILFTDSRQRQQHVYLSTFDNVPIIGRPEEGRLADSLFEKISSLFE